jgi:transcriptional regulator with XRE-family HTH domain
MQHKMKKEFSTLNDLIKELSPYINQSALARITEINMGQMRQYSSGVRNPSHKTLNKIINNLNHFGLELSNIRKKS